METEKLSIEDVKKIIEDKKNIEHQDGWFWVLLFIIFIGGWESLNNAEKKLQKIKRKDGDDKCMDMETIMDSQEI